MTDNPKPSTPPKNSVTNTSLADTPFSQGSGSHYSHQTNHTNADFKPYLEEDIKHRHFVEFDVFLKEILHAPVSDLKIYEKIANDQTYKQHVEFYSEDHTREPQRYSPFILLSNFIVEKLTEEKTEKDGKKRGVKQTIPFQFCRNDPTIVKGSAAERKPDLVVVSPDAFSAFDGERVNVDHCSTGGPKGAPFFWTELRTFVEFKLVSSNSVAGSAYPYKNNPSRASVPSLVPSSSATSEATKRNPPKPVPSSDRRLRSAVMAPAAPIVSSTSSKRAAANDDNRDPKRKKLGIDDPKSKRLDPMLQCASYALELLANGGLRSHVIGALVTDNWMELIYYDRSLIIVSKPFDFLAEPLKFIQVLHSFCEFGMQQWGFSDVVDSERVQPKQDPFMNVKLKLCGPDSRVLKLGRTVYGQHSLIGRGTIVVEAKCEGAEGEWANDLVVKFSWPAKSRVSEETIIRQAREYADATKDLDRLNHLPNILHAEDKEWSLLSEAFITSLGTAYERRVLRILVQEKLFPITDLHDAPSLAKPYKEIFYCYRWLVEEVKILHRDISPNNLMVRRRGTSVYGVLNDFDLAVDLKVDHPYSTSKHRTGTKPFMAIELLGPKPTKHLCRHDLESLFYALLWIALRFKAGKEIRGGPLEIWTNCSAEQLYKEKSTYMAEDGPVVTGAYKAIQNWVLDMFGLIALGRATAQTHRLLLRRLPQASYGTMVPVDVTPPEPHITFDAFEKILDAPVE